MALVVIRPAVIMLAIGSFLLLYAPILVRLGRDWAHDDNYSHGFLIIPIALYFVWERRERLAQVIPSPSLYGLPIVALGLLMLLAGLLGAELFLPRMSLLVVLTGTVLFLFGWQVCRVLALPLAFLVLMIPIPALIFNQIAFPLQLLASRVGETVLATVGIPVLREGNVIVLAHTTLEVAEACSGIRSLISLLTLGIVYGYFVDPRGGVRAAIALSTIPIAILANGGRVAGTGVAAHYYGVAAAQGFFHTFSGWLVFAVAFVMLFAVAHLLIKVLPGQERPGGVPAVAAQRAV
ncbi:MAG TPA: exosortase A [Vicinamibacterales bacterium]|nr:exosortase A [Vicinamibacterales bacterium]